MNIGDKVKVVNDFDNWLKDTGLAFDSLLTIIKEDDDFDSYINPDNKTIDIEAVENWPEDFEKVEDKFFAGCNQVSGEWSLNQPTVLAGMGRGFHLGAIGSNDTVPVTTLEVKSDELGMYRPNLEDRKVGKVGMHMVIDGFPRALREVAKVMTWAADAKGYKLHDWRNLPNADIAFPSAECRHQNDNSIMKAEGTPAIERTDHESNLLHAAHKVFNSLAELELILAGKIQ
jgi:hypothetical protein